MRPGDVVTYRTRRFAVNVGLVITFAIVIAGLLFIGYGLVRPFTHVHHDHRDVFHPPHLD
jgi:hypothetical protein